MVVMAIMVVMLSVSSIFMRSVSYKDYTHDLYLLRDVCTMMQQQALAERIEQKITFDLEHQRYEYAGFWYTLKDLVFAAPQEILGPPSSPQHVITRAITYPQAIMLCQADGKIKPGTLYLTSADGTQAYALTIPVGDVSYVRVYRAREKAWELLA